MKKRILVSLSSNIVVKNVSSDVYSVIRNSYLHKLNEFDFLPILVSGDMSKSIRDSLYDLCDGVLIPGGRDINPKLYNQKRHPKTQASDDLRDHMEIEIIKKTLKDKKPFLGICRGAQALAIVLGGTINQYLPDKYKGNHGFSDQELLGGKMAEHDVFIKPHTKAYSIFKSDKITVPSKHNQAIDNPGKLLISGKAADGVAEIIEYSKTPFHIGVQFHPEASAALDLLYKSFYTIVGSYRSA